MTELHCHILPGIDDGSEDVEMSLELMRRQKEQGITRIAFTSHFKPERMTLDEFLAGREEAYHKLLDAMGDDYPGMEFLLGSEVFFSPKLCDMDVRKLCIGDTDYMLVEFPTTHRPAYIDETFYRLMSQGVIPLIAHVERYPFVLHDLNVLYEWINKGMYAQVNASAIIHGGKMQTMVLNLIRWNLVQVIASDTHKPDWRRPNLAEGFDMVREKLGDQDAERLENNALAIFAGKLPEAMSVHQPKKFFGKWR